MKGWYRTKKGTDLQEHALLDDDGDGVGHHGAGVVGGDGVAAARFYLGDQGRRLPIDDAFFRWLEAQNERLDLTVELEEPAEKSR